MHKTKSNELIAEFMGYKTIEYGSYLLPENLPQFQHSNHGEWCSTQDNEDFAGSGISFYWIIAPENLQYDQSWDWLIPVIAKCESLNIPDWDRSFKPLLLQYFLKNDVRMAHIAVVGFLILHKSNQ